MKNKTTRILCGAAITLAACAMLSGGNSLPDQAQSYAVDEARYNIARKDENYARAEVIQARQDYMTAAKNAPEYKQAVGDVEKYNDQYQTTKKRVAADLTASDPAYQKLLKDRDACDKKLADARKAGNTDYQTFQDLYAEKEKVTNAMRKIEDVAMEKAGGADARKAWAQSCKSVDNMQQQQKAQVESSAQVLAAKDKVASLEKVTDEAAIKLAGSQAAYDEASFQQEKVDDYNFHHRDSMDYYDNWGWGGYGYRGVAVYRPAGGGNRGAVRGAVGGRR